MARRKRRRRKLTKSEQMARVRSKDTQPELILRRALWRRGCRYRLHVSLPGTPDMIFPGARVAVFIDGCFWHRCPEHYTEPAENGDFWRRKIERNVSRDASANERLAEAGWMVPAVLGARSDLGDRGGGGASREGSAGPSGHVGLPVKG